MGVVPRHVPLEAVRVLPCSATPEMSGGDVLFGAVAALGPGTSGVGSESAALVPTEFSAKTKTRSVWPASRAESTYVCVVRRRSSQAPPSEVQRRQRYSKRMGVSPSHVPLVAVSTEPVCVFPLTVGPTVASGAPAGAARTIRVGAERAVASPALVVAVTDTRSRRSTFAGRTG
jgi:hypothetical protein